MRTDLTRRVASLAPSVRRLVVDLGRSHHFVTRDLARSSLATLNFGERANLSLKVGEVLVSDLANAIVLIRNGRSDTRLSATPRTSPWAKGRADLAGRLAQPMRDRSAYRNRALVKAAGGAIWRPGVPGSDWLLVYEVTESASGPADDKTGVRVAAWVSGLYKIHVPYGWRSQTKPVGDGTGVIADTLILSAHPVAGEGTEFTIHEVIVAGIWTVGVIETRLGYAATWPGGNSLHGSFRRARDELAARSAVVGETVAPVIARGACEEWPGTREAA